MVGISRPAAEPSPPYRPGTLEGFVARLLLPPVVVQPAGIRLIGALAILLAAWTDLLFYNSNPGINIPIWVASLALAAVLAGRRLGRPIASDRLAVLGAAVALSTVTGWRDSAALQPFGVIGALGLLTLGLGLAPGLAVRRVSPWACAVAGIAAGASVATAWWRIAQTGQWHASSRDGQRGHVSVAVRSLAIATPLLLVFGSLFAAADAVFADRTGWLLDLRIDGLGQHLFWLIGGFSLTGAALFTSLGAALPGDVAVALPERHRLGRIEVGVILGLLALLFAAFVLIQVRYLFGGEEAVRSSIDITYAEYARRGFFELVAASLLLLPVLAAINWGRAQDARTFRLFLALAGTLVALLFVVMASAAQRLAMYWDAFGLTELRFYAAAVLVWLGAAVIWFMATLARRRSGEFLAGAILLAVATLLLLDVLNPDALIARTNLDRVAAGHPFDASYAGALSADSIPPLVERFDSVPAGEQCLLATAIRAHADPDGGWRSWNLARHTAARVVRAHPEIACGSGGG